MKQVIPNQSPEEAMDERLRRLTKEAINGGQQNQFGPAQLQNPQGTPRQLMQIPGGVPHGGPEGVLHRIAREASVRQFGK